MKALILCGGTGTRLRPLTFSLPKQLIPVANKPVVFYALEAVRAAGIGEVGVVVSDAGDAVRAAIGDGGRWGLRVAYIPQDAPRGLAHAVQVARPFLGDEPFLMVLGDNLIGEGVAGCVERFRSRRPDALVCLAEVDDPRRYGVAELRDGRVARVVEKPQSPPGNLALAGVYCFDRAVFEAVDAIAPSRRGELEITDAIQRLLEDGRTVEPYRLSGWWLDIGRPEDVLAANRQVLGTLEGAVAGEVDGASRITGPVVIEAGARVNRSVVRGPAVIGAGATVVNAYVGPYTSIGPGATLRGCEVEHSVVLAGATVRDVAGRIDESLIGREAAVTGGAGRPRAVRVVVGDHCRVGGL